MKSTATATNRHSSLLAEQAEALVEAYKEEGFTAPKDGEEKLSNQKLTERVRDVMLDKAIVRRRSEVQSKAIEPGDLAAFVFPSVTNPTSPDWPEDDDASDQAEITNHVWNRVLGAVSKAVQTGRKGSVQRALAADAGTSQLIVCSTKVGTKPKKAVFLSDDKDMIL